jgi:hypothetical protein
MVGSSAVPTRRKRGRPTREDTTGYQCKKCNKVFCNLYLLRRHIEGHSVSGQPAHVREHSSGRPRGGGSDKSRPQAEDDNGYLDVDANMQLDDQEGDMSDPPHEDADESGEPSGEPDLYAFSDDDDSDEQEQEGKGAAPGDEYYPYRCAAQGLLGLAFEKLQLTAEARHTIIMTILTEGFDLEELRMCYSAESMAKHLKAAEDELFSRTTTMAVAGKLARREKTVVGTDGSAVSAPAKAYQQQVHSIEDAVRRHYANPHFRPHLRQGTEGVADDVPVHDFNTCPLWCQWRKTSELLSFRHVGIEYCIGDYVEVKVQDTKFHMRIDSLKYRAPTKYIPAGKWSLTACVTLDPGSVRPVLVMSGPRVEADGTELHFYQEEQWWKVSSILGPGAYEEPPVRDCYHHPNGMDTEEHAPAPTVDYSIHGGESGIEEDVHVVPIAIFSDGFGKELLNVSMSPLNWAQGVAGNVMTVDLLAAGSGLKGPAITSALAKELNAIGPKSAGFKVFDIQTNREQVVKVVFVWYIMDIAETPNSTGLMGTGANIPSRGSFLGLEQACSLTTHDVCDQKLTRRDGLTQVSIELLREERAKFNEHSAKSLDALRTRHGVDPERVQGTLIAQLNYPHDVHMQSPYDPHHLFWENLISGLIRKVLLPLLNASCGLSKDSAKYDVYSAQAFRARLSGVKLPRGVTQPNFDAGDKKKLCEVNKTWATNQLLALCTLAVGDASVPPDPNNPARQVMNFFAKAWMFANSIWGALRKDEIPDLQRQFGEILASAEQTPVLATYMARTNTIGLGEFVMRTLPLTQNGPMTGSQKYEASNKTLTAAVHKGGHAASQLAMSADRRRTTAMHMLAGGLFGGRKLGSFFLNLAHPIPRMAKKGKTHPLLAFGHGTHGGREQAPPWTTESTRTWGELITSIDGNGVNREVDHPDGEMCWRSGETKRSEKRVPGTRTRACEMVNMLDETDANALALRAQADTEKHYDSRLYNLLASHGTEVRVLKSVVRQDELGRTFTLRPGDEARGYFWVDGADFRGHFEPSFHLVHSLLEVINPESGEQVLCFRANMYHTLELNDPIEATWGCAVVHRQPKVDECSQPLRLLRGQVMLSHMCPAVETRKKKTRLGTALNLHGGVCRVASRCAKHRGHGYPLDGAEVRQCKLCAVQPLAHFHYHPPTSATAAVLRRDRFRVFAKAQGFTAEYKREHK